MSDVRSGTKACMRVIYHITRNAILALSTTTPKTSYFESYFLSGLVIVPVYSLESNDLLFRCAVLETPNDLPFCRFFFQREERHYSAV